MGFFKLFKRKKNKEYDINDYIQDPESSSVKMDELIEEVVDVSNLSESELDVYVKSQCEAIEDASSYIAGLRREYDMVAEYYSDVERIDKALNRENSDLQLTAKKITELTADRQQARRNEPRLSNHKYYKMELAEAEMPGVLKDMQNNEAFLEAVKKDMRLLEGEKMSIKLDIRDLQRQKNNSRKLGGFALVVLAVLLVVLIAVNVSTPNEPNYAFLVVALIAAVVVTVLFSLSRRVEHGLVVARKKFNKCITLLNKVKIKCVNRTGILEYQYAKFDVKNSYEFSKQYGIYLDMKAEQRRLMKMTEELNSAEEHLIRLLREMNLNDSEIWLKQIDALIEPKEMVEIRHSLTIRRKKLREQIEFNKSKIDDAKKNIKQVAVNNPHYKDKVFAIIDSFESNSD